MSLPNISPVFQPIGIFDEFITRETETIVLKERILSLSGGSFDILSASGKPILRVKGKVMTISCRKSVYNMANRHLFDIFKKHLHLHTTFAVCDSGGNKILEVKSGFARMALLLTDMIRLWTSVLTNFLNPNQ